MAEKEEKTFLEYVESGVYGKNELIVIKYALHVTKMLGLKVDMDKLTALNEQGRPIFREDMMNSAFLLMLDDAKNKTTYLQDNFLTLSSSMEPEFQEFELCMIKLIVNHFDYGKEREDALDALKYFVSKVSDIPVSKKTFQAVLNIILEMHIKTSKGKNFVIELVDTVVSIINKSYNKQLQSYGYHKSVKPIEFNYNFVSWLLFIIKNRAYNSKREVLDFIPKGVGMGKGG